MNKSKSIGGLARSSRLTSSQKKEIAIKAISKNWDNSLPCATHEGHLCIGEKTINCIVADSGDRILSIKSVFETFGRTSRGYKKINREVVRPPFIDALNLEPFLSENLQKLIIPIEYRDLNGKIARGYKAEILPEICLTYLKADAAGRATTGQRSMIATSTVILGALSAVGIIGLIDEATGYQDERAADALSKILQAYIAKELQPWVSTVPAVFYKELFRLRGLEYLETSVRRPKYFGGITNNILYSRLAPGVLEELKRTCPRNEKGQLKHKYFQKLTQSHGAIKFREHIASVVSIMKLSKDYAHFMQNINQIHPKFIIDEFNEDEDTGVGI